MLTKKIETESSKNHYIKKKNFFFSKNVFVISGTLLRNGPGLFEFRDQKAKFYIPSTIKTETNIVLFYCWGH